MRRSTPYIDEFSGVQTDDDLLELAAAELGVRAAEIAAAVHSDDPEEADNGD
ncbi:hypothetical protein [Halobaculum magnesiiphilum]|uniref:Uncharacterized protein n=1 Tax=Halobaculum magnesiiphilum TaxID=1017351 RepID=A0A8T8WH68_9EURY|nr:hypothetical protein [Halobaculum magnesiiphilum]QZP39197.1 hypothetical protein K6T50_16175 [Halobaculum magnesiiphilum]